jgi:hypothetical protein
MDSLALYILSTLAALMLALGATAVALAFLGRGKQKRRRPF